MDYKNDIVDFLRRYKRFEDSAPLVTVDMPAIKSFLERYRGAEDVARKHDEMNASEFNIFNILRIERKEALTHTPFLAHLLNPLGSHSQRLLFYNSFVSKFFRGFESQFSARVTWKLRVKPESFGDIYGRMDILVEHICSENSFAWVVENKIDALDQDEQIQRYADFLLKSRNYQAGNVRIVYLTRSGKMPEVNSISSAALESLLRQKIFINISYSEIAEWLTELIPAVKAPRVIESLNQYLSIIKTL